MSQSSKAKMAKLAPPFKAPQLKLCQKMIAFTVYEKIYELPTQSEKQLNQKVKIKFFGDGADDQGYVGNFVSGLGRFTHLKNVDPLSNKEVFSYEFKGLSGLEFSFFDKQNLRWATLKGKEDLNGRIHIKIHLANTYQNTFNNAKCMLEVESDDEKEKKM